MFDLAKNQGSLAAKNQINFANGALVSPGEKPVTFERQPDDGEELGHKPTTVCGLFSLARRLQNPTHPAVPGDVDPAVWQA